MMRNLSVLIVVMLSASVALCQSAPPKAATKPASKPAAAAKPAAAKPAATPAVKEPSVADGYKRPTVTVPYAFKKPTMDGTINEDEWQGAESTNAMQTTSHQISPRQTRYWMMWDEDNLYVAMRSPLREGERLVQGFREKDKDINVVFDDSYEIWLDVASHSKDGQPVFFQFLCNYAGAHLDVMHEPAVGNSRMGYTSGWEPKNRVTPDGRAWEMELAIPRKSVFVEKPFAEGGSFDCLVARNFKKPWEQNSFEGTGSFVARETYSKFVLSKTAPAIHLLGVADPVARTLGVELAAFGVEDGQLAWSYESDGGVKQSGKLDVKKGQLTKATGTGLALETLEANVPSKGSYRIKVTSVDGKTTYLDWAALRKFGDLKNLKLDAPDKGDRVVLSQMLNPEKDYVRVRGDFIDFDERAKIDHCKVTVNVLTPAAEPNAPGTPGAEIAAKDTKIDGLAYVRETIFLKDLKPGKYLVQLQMIGKDGKALGEPYKSTIEKKNPADFPWWKTQAGSKDKVLPPWTPVKASGAELAVWGRNMTVGAAGLPAQITSQESPLLAGPVQLRAEQGGAVVAAQGAAIKNVKTADWQVVNDVAGKLGEDIDVTSRVTVEYDGMYKVEMTLTPKKPVDLQTLKLVVPFKEEFAEYIYGKGEGIRSGFQMGFLAKDKKGRVWDCLSVDSQPMVVGSFIPYVWLGNTKAGLCWFADSDEGWNPSSTTPAVEVRRDGASVDMVFNFISESTKLDKPRKIVFAFQASPAKPMHAGWRMDTWWCGDTFTNYVYPDNKGSLIWQSAPFTTDSNACKKLVDGKHRGMTYYKEGKKYDTYAVPYIEYNTMAAKEVAYFGEAWKTSAGPLYYGGSLQDFVMYNLAKWRDECGVDGWYLDNVRPVQCDNMDAGRGYRLPDGRVQPTYEMFAHRDFFLRLRSVFTEGGRTSKIVNHMTNNMILPWNGAVDVAYDGEHNVIYPEMDKDFMDFWSLERMRIDHSGTWGVVVNFMNEYQGTWEPARKLKVMRAYTGAVLMFDALPTGNSFTDGAQRTMLGCRDKFGVGENDVKFIAYWEKDSGLSCATKDVYTAAWQRPGKVLVAVVNWGEQAAAQVKVDLKKLGLPAAAECKVYDAETDTAMEMAADGTITLPVERHDYRQIVIEKK